MVHTMGLVRFSGALIFSGVLWATFLFLMNACALDRRVPFLGVGLAVGVLGVAADLFTRAVAGTDLLALLR
jgi:hypothetical protein